MPFTKLVSVVLILNPDINECNSDALNECDSNALCTNTEGFYVCRCVRGYQGDGRYCVGKIIILCFVVRTKLAISCNV